MRFSVRAVAGTCLTPVPLLLVSACFGFWIQFARGGGARIDIHLLVSDAVALLLIAIVALRRDLRRDVRALRIPAPLCFLAGVTLVGAATQGGVRGIADALQAIEYMVLVAALFALDPRGLDRLPLIFSWVGALVCGVALVQYIQHPQQPFAVASLYENRNVLGCVLVVLIPVVMACTLSSTCRGTRVLGIATLAMSVFVTTAWQALLALAVAGAAMAMLFPGHRRGWAVFCGLAVLALWTRAENGAFLEPRTLAGYTDRLERRALMTRKHAVLQSAAGTSRIALLIPRPPALGLNDDCRHMIETWNRSRVFGDGHHLSQEVTEWNAALGMFATAPLLGFGPGNYQRFVSAFYGSAPKLNSMEPDSQSGLLVLGATMGAVGVALILLAAGTSVALAWRRRAQGTLEVTVAGNLGFLAGACFLPVPQRAESLVFLIALVVRDAMRNSETSRADPPVAHSAGVRRKTPPATRAVGSLRTPGAATLAVFAAALVALVAAPFWLRESIPLTPDVAAARVPGAAIQVLLALSCMGVAWLQRSPRVLQIMGTLLLAWLVAALAPATLHFQWSGAQVSVRPVLVTVLLLAAMPIVAHASNGVAPPASPFLRTVFAVLLAGIAAATLLWLCQRLFYRTDATALATRVWPLAAVAIALRAAESLLAPAIRLRVFIVAACVGVVLLAVVPLMRDR